MAACGLGVLLGPVGHSSAHSPPVAPSSFRARASLPQRRTGPPSLGPLWLLPSHSPGPTLLQRAGPLQVPRTLCLEALCPSGWGAAPSGPAGLFSNVTFPGHPLSSDTLLASFPAFTRLSIYPHPVCRVLGIFILLPPSPC